MVDKRHETDKLINELIAGKTPEEIVGEGEFRIAGAAQLTTSVMPPTYAMSLSGTGNRTPA